METAARAAAELLVVAVLMAVDPEMPALVALAVLVLVEVLMAAAVLRSRRRVDRAAKAAPEA